MGGPIPLWFLALLGAGVAAALALGARGLAGDEEIGHFLIARAALSQPELYLNPYGRPLVTLGFSLPVQGGLWTARIFAALLAGATTYAVVRLAVRTRWLPPFFAVVLLFLQPYFLAYAATVMSEPVAAMLVAWGLLAFVERRMLLLALVAGLLPLARQEWLVLWPLVAWVLYREGRLRYLWVQALPMFLWAAVAGLWSGDPLWIVRQVDWRTYAKRDPAHYLLRFAWIVGAGLLVPVMVGLSAAFAAWFRTGDDPGEKSLLADRRRVLLACAILVSIMLVTYTAFAVWHPVTFGMLRFLAGLAPAFALLALAGVGDLLQARRQRVWVALGLALAGAVLLWRHGVSGGTFLVSTWDFLPAATVIAWSLFYIIPRRSRTVALLLPVLFGVFFLVRSHLPTLHLVPNPGHVAVARAAEALRPRLGAAPSIISSHPALAYFLSLNFHDKTTLPGMEARLLGPGGASSWVLWDSHYAPAHGSAFALGSLLQNADWAYRGGVVATDSTLAVALFERRAAQGEDAARAPLPGTQAEAAWAPGARRIQAGLPRDEARVREDPGNAKSWRSLAYRQQQFGDLAGALRSLAVAEGLDPHDPSGTSIRVSILLETGRAAEALRITQDALQHQPNHGRLQYLMGRTFLELGRAEEARAYLLEAAARLPEDWVVQYAAGLAMARERKWAEAEEYLGTSLRIKPDYPEAVLLSAEVAYRQRESSRAVELLEGLIVTHPTQARAYLLLERILREQGRGVEATRVREEGFRATGDPALRGITGRPSSAGDR